MKNLFAICLLICLGACSENNSNSQTAANDTAKSNQATGNKFKDAAIKKIASANPGLSVEQSQCVVESMTADGKIGLGEINQMKLAFNDLASNGTGLLVAYKNALKNCQ